MQQSYESKCTTLRFSKHSNLPAHGGPALFFRGIFAYHTYLQCLSHHPQNPHSSLEAGFQSL